MNKKAGPHNEEKRAEVFVSASSGDLRTMREIVKHGLLTMGCFPVEQTNFPPDYRSVREMIEARVAQCDAVIHIVGRRYGAEPDPATLPPGAARRSYTQMEADVARQLGKKLYVFLCPEDFPYDEEPDVESAEKRALQQAYRQQVTRDQTLHTPVRDRDDLAVKVRELQFELEKLRGAMDRGRTRTFAMMGALLVVLVVIATGVWWTATRMGGAFHYDRNRTREMLATAIRDNAEKLIQPLDPVRDWRQIKQIQDEEAQQLADLDHYLDSIEQTSQRGEASQSYMTATRLLQEKGVGEALDYLDSTSGDRATEIEQQKNRIDRDEEDLRKLLKEDLLKASLLEKQFRFAEAEQQYRQTVEDGGAWAEPRNDFAWFLGHRGKLVDPARGNAMLREAAEICQGTVALNPRDKSPEDWATAQNDLGFALDALGTRIGGEEGNGVLRQAAAACESALEVRTKDAYPVEWAATQNNLGNTLADLASRRRGDESTRLLDQAIEAYNSALEVRTKAALPRDWAVTENNLGAALEELGKRTGEPKGSELIQQAVAAYEHALEVDTKAGYPLDWAMTLNNLGTALVHLGDNMDGPGGEKPIWQAIDAYRNTLEVHTRADVPQDWAITETNLGNALLDLGMRVSGTEGTDLMQQAVNAYSGALEIRTKADLPQGWAAIQGNLGNALDALAANVDGAQGEHLLKQCADTYRSTLDVYTKTDLPQDWAQIQYDIGRVLDELGRRDAGQAGAQALQQSADAYRGALEVYTKADLPRNWADTEYNLGNVLDALGSRCSGDQCRSLLQQSVDAYNCSMQVYTQSDWTETKQVRDAVLADLAKAKASP
ncbi:MAG: DUF4062 domain-containing protein [Chthoniobacteraceae bacterium]|jgi:tetratricopeptide (TPR) repeat protein